MTLHERIAALLGWKVEDTQSFSLLALRELVRTAPPSKARDAIVAEISALRRSGRIILSSCS